MTIDISSPTLDLANELLEKFKVTDTNYERMYLNETITAVCSDGEIEGIPYLMFYINFLMLLPHFVFEKEIHSDDLWFPDHIHDLFSKSFLRKKINASLQLFFHEDPEMLNQAISMMVNSFKTLSGKANIYHGTTIDLYTLVKLSSAHKEVENILKYSLPDGLDFKGMEVAVDKLNDRLISILRSTESSLQIYFASGAGINDKQFRELAVSIGLKPDLQGNIIPNPINTSFLQGFSTVEEFFINAAGARKALVNNERNVKQSGYFARKLALLVLDTFLSDEDDCGTTHYLDVFVKDKKVLQRYEKQFYLVGDELHEILGDEKHLIGQTIQVRSPIFCKCADNKICKTCYGSLAHINDKMHVGLISVLLLTNQLTQRLLSSKHLLQTNAATVDWSFLKEYFFVNKNTILSADKRNSIILKGQSVLLDHQDDMYEVLEFDLVSADKTETINPSVRIFLSDSLKEAFLAKVDFNSFHEDNDEIEIKLNDLDSDLVFIAKIDNTELSTALYEIIEMLDKNEELFDGRQFMERILTLAIDSKLNIQAVHLEVMARALLRDLDDHTKYANMRVSKPSYKFVRVSEAIIKAPSPLLSLSFERIRSQITNTDLYSKSATSVIDKLFVS